MSSKILTETILGYIVDDERNDPSRVAPRLTNDVEEEMTAVERSKQTNSLSYLKPVSPSKTGDDAIKI